MRWLVEHVEAPRHDTSWGSTATRALRERLVRRDPDAIRDALAALAGGDCSQGWHVLEGPSYPDALLETQDSVIVVEGKRTEARPTTATSWMRVRNQMLRHMDGASETLGGRQLVGFYIVEAPEGELAPSKAWREYAAETVAPDHVAASLPHRTPLERQALVDAFVGVTTWQQVCQTFHLPTSLLISELWVP
ncbi:MAG: hypothetical protein U0Q11_24155 [Vicinamibacterales bacterium]